MELFPQVHYTFSQAVIYKKFFIQSKYRRSVEGKVVERISGNLYITFLTPVALQLSLKEKTNKNVYIIYNEHR